MSKGKLTGRGINWQETETKRDKKSDSKERRSR
jgi:hypothetical protein